MKLNKDCMSQLTVMYQCLFPGSGFVYISISSLGEAILRVWKIWTIFATSLVYNISKLKIEICISDLDQGLFSFKIKIFFYGFVHLEYLNSQTMGFISLSLQTEFQFSQCHIVCPKSFVVLGIKIHPYFSHFASLPRLASTPVYPL